VNTCFVIACFCPSIYVNTAAYHVHRGFHSRDLQSENCACHIQRSGLLGGPQNPSQPFVGVLLPVAVQINHGQGHSWSSCAGSWSVSGICVSANVWRAGSLSYRTLD
jgi:hypothetical protein